MLQIAYLFKIFEVLLTVDEKVDKIIYFGIVKK
jgi:hypothetical protein